MKSKVLFTFGILICGASCGVALAMSDEGTIIDWGDKPTVGTISKKGAKNEYLLTMKFGVEGCVLGEESNSNNPDHSVLWLNCSSSGSDGNPWCELKWVYVDCLIDPASPYDCSFEYSTFEENLDLSKTHWETGELNLELIEPGSSSRTRVYVRLKYENSLIRLESFRGYSDPRHIPVLKETLPPIEYKIPPYTYALGTPVKLRGMLSESQKQWDDLIKSLSKQDQSTWEAMKRNSKRRPDLGPDTKSLEERLNREIPDFEGVAQGKRKPTPAEDKILDRVVAEEAMRWLGEWVATSGFSREAQGKVMAFLSKKILEEQLHARSR